MMKKLLLAASLLIPLVAVASLSSDLGECAIIKKDKARLACFDALVADSSAPVDELPGEARQLTDEVGRKKTTREISEEAYDVVVTECEKINQRVYFTLDNGQVWRQSNSKWLSTRNCTGAGMISRDFWGYRLSVETMDKTVRVNRAK
jgi:hypothetical protein